MRKFSIGVFDSGFGGLNILKELAKKLPQYNFIYLGDNARAPYGERSQNLIYEFTKQGVDFLFKKGCGLIILACNTASSEALHRIQQEFLPKFHKNGKVLGVIIPAAQEAVKLSKNKKVGVIATQGTVNSGAFEREIKKINPKIRVFQKACPLLVPLIEAGEYNSKAVFLILGNYLKPLKKRGIDTLVLGCTHYGILSKQIAKIAGHEVTIVSEGKLIAEKLADYLKRHPEIQKNLSQKEKVILFTTDLTDRFEILGKKFFGRKIYPIKISLD